MLWFSLRRERAPALHLYCQPDGIVAGSAVVFLAAGASPRPTFILSARWYRCGQCCGLCSILPWFSSVRVGREQAPALHLYCQPDGIVAGSAVVFLAAGASPRPTFILSARWYRCGSCFGFPCGGSKPPPYIYIVSPMVSLRAVLWFSLRREQAPALHLFSPRPTFIWPAWGCSICQVSISTGFRLYIAGRLGNLLRFELPCHKRMFARLGQYFRNSYYIAGLLTISAHR